MMLLECSNCQSCFNVFEWMEQYEVTNKVLEYFTGEANPLPENLNENELYNYLYINCARMDCPDCGEVVCIEDLCIV